MNVASPSMPLYFQKKGGAWTGWECASREACGELSVGRGFWLVGCLVGCLVGRWVVGRVCVTVESGERELEGKRGVLRCCEGSGERLSGQSSLRDGEMS